MAEIKIQVDELEQKILKLRYLRNEIELNPNECPVVVGGGSSIAELEEIALIYRTLNDSLLSLVDNTMVFMDNLKESYAKGDREAAKKIDGK